MTVVAAALSYHSRRVQVGGDAAATLSRLGALALALVGCIGSEPVAIESADVAGAPNQRSRSAAEAAAVAPPADVVTVAALQPTQPACPPLAAPVLQLEATPPAPDLERADTLAPFYNKVVRLLRGRATEHVRIAVYGDSNLTMDFMTGQMRRVLQGQFGDGGHGFVALARPWSHYKHMDVRHGVRGSLESYACSTHPTHDPYYGISCIVGESRDRNGGAWLATAKVGAPVGTVADHFEVFYLRGKRYGQFAVEVDGERVAEVDAQHDEPALGHYQIDVPAGKHRLAVKQQGGRPVRWLGAVMEHRARPSFVVDSFGVGAMNTPSQVRQGAAMSVPMLRERGYDLVIFATGANDGFSMHKVPADLDTMIKMQRQALPDVPVILLTPTDRGKSRTFGPTYQVVLQRRELAAQYGVALWDMFEAMGGKNSMRAFRRRGLAKSDYIHVSQQGGAYLGDRLLNALWRGLKSHLANHPTAGCEP